MFVLWFKFSQLCVVKFSRNLKNSDRPGVMSTLLGWASRPKGLASVASAAHSGHLDSHPRQHRTLCGPPNPIQVASPELVLTLRTQLSTSSSRKPSWLCHGLHHASLQTSNSVRIICPLYNAVADKNPIHIILSWKKKWDGLVHNTGKTWVGQAWGRQGCLEPCASCLSGFFLWDRRPGCLLPRQTHKQL